MMKREVCAGILLALLFIGALLNIEKISNVTDAAAANIYASEQAASCGDTETAEEKLNAAFSVWSKAEGYMRVFVRHSETDSTNEAFFNAFGTLSSGDAKEISAAFAALEYHIRQIADMERLSIGSIL